MKNSLIIIAIGIIMFTLILSKILLIKVLGVIAGLFVITLGTILLIMQYKVYKLKKRLNTIKQS